MNKLILDSYVLNFFFLSNLKYFFFFFFQPAELPQPEVDLTNYLPFPVCISYYLPFLLVCQNEKPFFLYVYV